MKSHCIANAWIEGAGEEFAGSNPATGETVWRGRAATADEVDRAARAAREASGAWQDTPIEKRINILNAFAEQLKKRRDELADQISRSMGKPRWESLLEVDAMIGKIPLTITAHNERRSKKESEANGVTQATRYKPHGVVAVFGPFNFPGHLPNGHIAPALIEGNCVVFKPSEMTPLVGQTMMECWLAAGIPAGVFNLIQGARETGQALAAHAEIDGIFFTGSAAGGTAINKALADQPGKILALELGGNNPLVVWGKVDLDAAAYQIIQSAFVTSGQRCSCARRLIVPEDAQPLIDRLTDWTKRIRVGKFDSSPEPFMGPVISKAAADRVMSAKESLVKKGAKSILEMKQNGAMLTPGILETTGLSVEDEEVFGPLLQIIRVKDFDAAIAESNRTKYGLSAGLLSEDRKLYDEFYKRIRAGVVNWNKPTTGASSALPFGGVGMSGNHRPSAFFAVDYCSYPVASLEEGKMSLPAKMVGFE